MDTPSRYGFPALFLCLLALLVLPPYFSDLGISGVSWWLLATVLLASLYLVANNRRQLIIGVVLALPTLAFNMSRELLDIHTSVYLSYLLYVVFFAYIQVFLLRYFLATRTVTADMIFAAMCAYIIVGLAWMFIYACIELRVPGSFVVAQTGASPSDMIQFNYFSFVTLTTLGYGDVTPVSDFARSWAMVEAILGQFYLAVVLARIVGLHISAQQHDENSK
ncbi:MAG: voltage-gated potassium channel [Halioglobus sp.]|jgi:voltage-gated potassium channel